MQLFAVLFRALIDSPLLVVPPGSFLVVLSPGWSLLPDADPDVVDAYWTTKKRLNRRQMHGYVVVWK